ncbi:MAG: DsbA family protein [Acidobacteriia bacterium]|nr:DsbA family protein [Terriglobia bacterium]
MLRWVQLMVVRRAFLVLLLICLGCSAQSAPPDIRQLVERHVRAHYSLPPEMSVTVGPTRPSEFPNYDILTVTLDSSGKKQNIDFLLSKDRKTMVRMTKMDLTEDPYAAIMKKIDVTGRPTRGNKDAKVVAINYDDFQCPFCSRMHQQIFPTIFKEYGDRVLFIYKDFPLEDIHPWAIHAAVDANCLAAQNGDSYWEYADYLHANQHSIGGKDQLDKLATLLVQKHNLDAPKLAACLKAQDEKAVRASMQEADNLGVSATPMIFVNGQRVDGAVPPETLRAVLDRALKDAGVAPPEHKSAGGGPNAQPAQPSK